MRDDSSRARTQLLVGEQLALPDYWAGRAGPYAPAQAGGTRPLNAGDGGPGQLAGLSDEQRMEGDADEDADADEVAEQRG